MRPLTPEQRIKRLEHLLKRQGKIIHNTNQALIKVTDDYTKQKDKIRELKVALTDLIAVAKDDDRLLGALEDEITHAESVLLEEG